MEFKITSTQILTVLNVMAWIIFIGLCVETGSFVFNAVFAFALKPAAAGYFQLSDLYAHDQGCFLVTLLLMTIVGAMRTLMFYLIIRLLHNEKLDFSRPFNAETGRFLFLMSYLAVGAGFFSHWGANYTEWLAARGIAMPDIQVLRLGGADVWLFMGATLFVLAHIFRKGIEIQSDNELTI